MTRLQTESTNVPTLLLCGMLVGPLYMGISLILALTQPSFDLTKHALSMLLVGDVGWLQTVNFELTGLLLILAAIGWRGALKDGQGGEWAPRLLILFGLGMMLAGIFHPDPAMGYPSGTPLETTGAQLSWRAGLHFLTGTIGFLGFIGACFVMASRFAAQHEKNWALASRLIGALFFIAFAGIASGSTGSVTVAFILAVGLGFAWIFAVSAKFRRAWPEVER